MTVSKQKNPAVPFIIHEFVTDDHDVLLIYCALRAVQSGSVESSQCYSDSMYILAISGLFLDHIILREHWMLLTKMTKDCGTGKRFPTKITKLMLPWTCHMIAITRLFYDHLTLRTLLKAQFPKIKIMINFLSRRRCFAVHIIMPWASTR